MSYESCEHLRHSIQFWCDQISFCCQSGIRTPEYFCMAKNYNGEKLDWDKLNAERAEHLDNMKNGIKNIYCDGCEYAKLDDWEEYTPKINSIIISHWTKCNSDCIYCKIDKNEKKKPYKIIPILKDMKAKNLIDFKGRLLFGGGEPTCLDEFEKILDFFYKNEIEDVQINSSGIKFSKTIAKYLEREGTKLTISPDSSDEALYRKIKRVNKHKDVWNNIKKYAAMQKQNIYGVKTKFIILPGINIGEKEIENWLIKSKENGVNSVILDVEAKWYAKYKENIPQKLIGLFNFFETKAKEMGLKTSYYAVGEFIKPLLQKDSDC